MVGGHVDRYDYIASSREQPKRNGAAPGVRGGSMSTDVSPRDSESGGPESLLKRELDHIKGEQQDV